LDSCLIRGGHLFDGHRPLEALDILVVDGLIAAVGPGLEPPHGAPVIEAAGRIVMPGLINAHTHSNQALEKGLCDRYPLDAWMVIASYGGASAELRPRDLYVSAAIGAIEMLRSGATAALDMARIDPRWFEEGSDAVMQAYADVGLRAAVAVTITDLDFASSLPLELVPGALEELKPKRVAKVDDVVANMEGFIQRWKGRHPRLTPMVGPSSLPRCSTELFTAAVDVARRHGVGMQTHLLSAKSQVFVGQKRYGGSTVDFLQRLDCLQDWASFAHAIWLDDREVEVMGRSGAVVAHNPVSNLKLGAGRSPVPALLRAGARVALGSDGASSADNQNMFETVKGAAIVHRIAHDQSDWITAPAALDMCWSGGAAALRQRLGRIEVGYQADLTLLNRRSLFLSPKEQLAGQIVHSELGNSVESVIVAGRLVVDGGRLTTVDETALHEEAQEIISRIYEGLPDRMRKFEALRPMMQTLERTVNATALHFSRYCC
jgi:5-methylthioadenosine/S-adenosylhomocysteine deaminase